MIFNVSGLIQEGIGATREYHVDGPLVGDGRPPEPVSGRVQLLRTRDGVLVRARLTVMVSDACSRCLRPVEEPVDIEFEEEFLPIDELADAKIPQELAAAEPFLIDEHHLLDISEAVRQYREASARMQPLCRPDCRGLCPRCGSDLNAGECGCEAGAVDSRWVGLEALRGAFSERKD
jgi:uncharacterized protein